jgi:hypothetical protein
VRYTREGSILTVSILFPHVRAISWHASVGSSRRKRIKKVDGKKVRKKK